MWIPKFEVVEHSDSKFLQVYNFNSSLWYSTLKIKNCIIKDIYNLLFKAISKLVNTKGRIKTWFKYERSFF